MRPVSGLFLIVAISALSLSPAGAQVMVDNPTPATNKKVLDPFGFEHYSDIIDQMPEKEQYRLCGLDKVCMTLWRTEKLQISRKGRLVQGDFNDDGVPDEAIVLERDIPGVMGKEYYLAISTKAKKDRQLVYEEELPLSHGVVDFFWDPDKKALGIDTGERLFRQHSAVTPSDGSLIARDGVVEKMVAWIRWNPKKKIYELNVKGSAVKGKDKQ